jgi:excisionase family DNA binding protein
MNAQTLPLPNPEDWCSVAGAARLLGVSRRTVERMVLDGRLTGYTPYGGSHRVSAKLLWMPEVRQLSQALARVRRPGHDA